MLTANLPLVLCFKLSHLLAFYGRTVEQMLGSGAHLTDTLVDCHKLSNRLFHEQLKARGNKLIHHKAAPPKDLSVPPQVSLLLLSLQLHLTCVLKPHCRPMYKKAVELQLAMVKPVPVQHCEQLLCLREYLSQTACGLGFNSNCRECGKAACVTVSHFVGIFSKADNEAAPPI